MCKSLRKLFPDVILCRARRGKHQPRDCKYKGLKLKIIDSQECGAENISVPAYCTITQSQPNLVISVNTEDIVNDKPVVKMITFSDGMFEVTVNNTDIQLDELGIDNKYSYICQSDTDSVIKMITQARLCKGMPVPDDFNDFDKFIINKWTTINGNEILINVHSPYCSGLLPFTNITDHCDSCRRGLHQHMRKCESTDTPEGSQGTLIESDLHEDLLEILQSTLPNCPTNFKCLLKSQLDNFEREPRQRRWAPEIISLCLTLYSRSRQAYTDLKESNMLLLPSGRLLKYYKNSVHQTTGFVRENLLWMQKEADRQNISTSGRHGGLLLDEMQIQDDLQVPFLIS